MEVSRPSQPTIGKELVDSLAQSVPIAFAIHDNESRYIWLNDEMAAIDGKTIAEHVGFRIADLFPDLWPLVEPHFARAWQGKVSAVSISGTSSDDPQRDISFLANYFPIRNDDEEVVAVGASAVDVSNFAIEKELGVVLRRIASLVSPDEQSLPQMLRALIHVPLSGFSDICAIALEDHGLYLGLNDNEELVLEDEALRAFMDLADRVATEPKLLRLRESDDADDVLDRLACASAIIVPLSIGGQRAFVIFGRLDPPMHRYVESHIERAREIASWFATAMSYAILSDQAGRDSRKLNVLVRSGELVLLGLDERVRAEGMRRVLVPEFADECLLFRHDGSALRLANDDAFDEVVIPKHQPTHELCGHIVRVSETGRPFTHNRFRPLESDCITPALLDEPTGVRMSVLAVALADGPVDVGVLVLLRNEQRDVFTDDEASIASEFARRAAAAMADASQFQEQRTNAESIQRSLLPHTVHLLKHADAAARYLPGTDSLRVGGDWYDTIMLPDDSALLVIGDVAGHGIEAASSMARLRNMTLRSALLSAHPEELLHHFNHLTFETGRDFATVGVAWVNAARTRIRYSSAGHLPLFVCRGKRIEIVQPPIGALIGASSRSQYGAVEQLLDGEEILFLCTDGLLERRGEVLDDGIARLIEALRSADTSSSDQFLDDVFATMVASESRDDIAALAVHFT